MAPSWKGKNLENKTWRKTVAGNELKMLMKHLNGSCGSRNDEKCSCTGYVIKL
jgi:hypothetical protein